MKSSLIHTLFMAMFLFSSSAISPIFAYFSPPTPPINFTQTYSPIYIDPSVSKRFWEGVDDFFAKPVTTTRDIYIPSPNTLSIDDIFTNTLAAAVIQWVIVAVDEPNHTVSFIPQFDTSLFSSFDRQNTDPLYLSTITVIPSPNATHIFVTMHSKPRLTDTVSAFSKKMKAKIPQIYESIQ